MGPLQYVGKLDKFKFNIPPNAPLLDRGMLPMLVMEGCTVIQDLTALGWPRRVTCTECDYRQAIAARFGAASNLREQTFWGSTRAVAEGRS